MLSSQGLLDDVWLTTWAWCSSCFSSWMTPCNLCLSYWMEKCTKGPGPVIFFADSRPTTTTTTLIMHRHSLYNGHQLSKLIIIHQSAQYRPYIDSSSFVAMFTTVITVTILYHSSRNRYIITFKRQHIKRYTRRNFAQKKTEAFPHFLIPNMLCPLSFHQKWSSPTLLCCCCLRWPPKNQT